MTEASYRTNDDWCGCFFAVSELSELCSLYNVKVLLVC